MRLFTQERIYLEQMYHELAISDGILELDDFSYHGCTIRISYIAKGDSLDCDIMTLFIRTNDDVVFVPIYIKEKESEYFIETYFDKESYKALRNPIIAKDGYKVNGLFNSISKHILDSNSEDYHSNDKDVLKRYSSERTAIPDSFDNGMFPYTLKRVRIGIQSKSRIKRIFPYPESYNVIKALEENNMTVVFTHDFPVQEILSHY